MFVLLLLAAAFCQANVLPRKANQQLPPIGYCQVTKSPKQGPFDCPFSFGGFHVICGEFPYFVAAALCEERGWRLAAIDDLNIMFALQTHRQCNPSGGEWTAAFNGFNQNPLQSLVGNGTVVVGESMFVYPKAVLCQNVPVVATNTATTTTTFTTSDGTITTRVTVTRHPHCHEEKLQLEKLQPKAFLQKPQTVCNNCSPVCAIPDTNLRIIKRKVNHLKAGEECAKYGWTLADVTEGHYEAVQVGRQSCNTTSFDGLGLFWIRSYDGVTGGYCPAVQVGERAQFTGLFPYAQSTCEFLNAQGSYPLCRCGKPVITGLGPYEGSVTTTSTTTIATLVTVVPQTTTTVTTTVHRRCHHHECHRHHDSSSSTSSSSSESKESSSSESSESSSSGYDADSDESFFKK